MAGVMTWRARLSVVCAGLLRTVEALPTDAQSADGALTSCTPADPPAARQTP
jgi:hypothetical protein